MPGLVHLLAQPLNTAVIDYPRCLLSVKVADPVRCVSAFPVMYDQVRQRGGVMLVLAARDSGRIFGLVTLTPGPAPGRAHSALIDFSSHDHYQPMASRRAPQITGNRISLGGRDSPVLLRAARGDLEVLCGFEIIIFPLHFRGAPKPSPLRILVAEERKTLDVLASRPKSYDFGDFRYPALSSIIPANRNRTARCGVRSGGLQSDLPDQLCRPWPI